jgi:hypothetical protein
MQSDASFVTSLGTLPSFEAALEDNESTQNGQEFDDDAVLSMQQLSALLTTGSMPMEGLEDHTIQQDGDAFEVLGGMDNELTDCNAGNETDGGSGNEWDEPHVGDHGESEGIEEMSSDEL